MTSRLRSTVTSCDTRDKSAPPREATGRGQPHQRPVRPLLDEQLGRELGTEIDQLARALDRRRVSFCVEGGTHPAALIPDPWLSGYGVSVRPSAMTSHHGGCRAVGLGPELERASRAEGNRLASIEVGQRQRIAGKDREQLDWVTGLVGEGRHDLTTLDVAKDREGALAGDHSVVRGRGDLPRRLVRGCCGRNRECDENGRQK